MMGQEDCMEAPHTYGYLVIFLTMGRKADGAAAFLFVSYSRLSARL